MATDREYLRFLQEQCAGLDVRFRAMMGEYVFYYRDKVAGTVCDNRFMVKDVPAARALMPDALLEPPYEGAKEQLVVDVLDNRHMLAELFEVMYPELPAPKPRRKKS